MTPTSDIESAPAAETRPIQETGVKLNMPSGELLSYGPGRATLAAGFPAFPAGRTSAGPTRAPSTSAA